jgi:hypothetical protein
MSAEMASSINSVEVFVPLLNEGTTVLRPTTGVILEADVVEILPTTDYDPAVEDWEFPPGSKVKCVTELRGGRKVLVARQRIR